MNKSKFLKKSLAVLLAVLMATAMIPLSAAAADPLTIKEGGAYLYEANGTDGGILLDVDNTAHTITGRYPTSRTDFILDVLPTDACSAVNYAADHVTAVPTQPMTESSGHYKTPALPKTGYLFQEDGKEYIKMTVALAGDGTNSVLYKVTLEVSSNDVSSELTGFRVWTSDSSLTYDQVEAEQAQPQLYNTKIDQDKKTIDITVPYDTQYVWVRDFAPAGATVNVGLVNSVAENDLILGTGSSNGAWNATDSSVKELSVVVSAKDGSSSSTTTYTLKLTRAAGFESFGLKDGTEAKVFNKDNTIVAILPFGYKQDNQDGDTLKVIPQFDLTWTDKEVSYVKAKLDQSGNTGDANARGTDNQETLVPGETAIKVKGARVYEDYAPDTGTKLADAKDRTEMGGYASTQIYSADITVFYVEGSKRDYQLYIYEAVRNDQAVIHSLSIGSEDATIDQDKRTIDITVPYGTDITKIPVSSVKISASDNIKKPDKTTAGITVEYQSGVKFKEDDTSSSKAGNVPAATRTVKRNYVNDASTTTLDGTKAIIRVVSEDTKTTHDYTLTVKAAESRETPALKTVTLQDKDGNNYEGTLAADTKTFVFELPYATRTIGDLDGWKLFYTKTVGAKVENAEWPVNGGKLDTDDQAVRNMLLSKTYETNGTTATNTVIKATKNDYLKPNFKGAAIELSASEAGINDQDKDTFYLMLTRKTPNAVAGLSKFSLASPYKDSQGSTPTTMSYKELNDENTYAAKIDNKTGIIDVMIPHSHYQLGNATKGYMRNTMFPAGVETTGNSTVWYAPAGGSSDGFGNLTLMKPITEGKTSSTCIDMAGCDSNETTGTTLGGYYYVVVLSEQVTVDLGKGTDAISTTDWDAAKTNNTLPALGYKIYKMHTVSAKPTKTARLESLSLVDSRGRVADVALTVNTAKKTITGTVPYGMTTSADPANKIFLKYTTNDKSASVLSGTITTNPGVDGSSYINAWVNSTAGHFDNAGVHSLTDAAGAKALDCDYLANGGAYIQITPDSAHIKGDVTLHAKGGTADALKNKLSVASEEYLNSKFTELTTYTFDLNVAAARNDASFKSFSLGGFTGAISGNVINVTVSQGTDKTALVPTFTLADGAYIQGDAIVSGKTPLNFSTERLITVVAENGKTTKTYRVNVTEQEGFFDVPKGAWYYNDVMTAFEKEWITGVRPGYFNPTGTMKRGDFAMMIAKIKGYDKDKYTESAFPDVPADKYYSPAIAFCHEQGYISGDNTGKFNPEKTITRQEAAVFMCKVAGLTPIEGNTKFADDARIGGWAKKFINACVDAKIYAGKDGNRFDPTAQLKRCEGASLLVRAFNK